MNKIFSLILRYSLILILGLGNLFFIYLILTPLTIYVTYGALSLFSSATLSNGLISLGGSIIEIVPACVAGAAYYLLLILILSLPNHSMKEYLKFVGISFSTFFLINILRIVLLIVLRNSISFDLIHKIFWYFVSVILVVLIWFFLVNKYKIKEYPIVSDVSYLLSFIKKSKKAKNSK